MSNGVRSAPGARGENGWPLPNRPACAARPGAAQWGSESGMVTVETAIGLGGVVSVVLALVLALSVGSTKAEVCQVAREVARAASLGETYDASAGPGRSNVTVGVESSGDWLTARVSAPAFAVGGWRAPSLTCSAKTIRESAYANG